jgi:Domain of unknown function (DUF1127)
MFAVNQDKADKSPGRALKDLRGALLKQLVVVEDRLELCRVFRWFQDEARRSAMIRELNLLNDYCLDDIGIRRPYDLKTDDLVKRLRAGG